MIYLDWNATTPPLSAVVEAMGRALGDAWANPSSLHGPGRRARAHVESAREAVAALLGVDVRDLVLTSGGTEANNLALGAARGGALVVSRIEHPSITRVAEALEADPGAVVEWVGPEATGVISPDAVADAVARAARRAPVRLVSLQAVNHETGVIQAVAEVAEIAHRAGARLHVDAVQAVGRLAPSAWEGADLVSLAAHKLRGPKGIGALALPPGLKLAPVLRGGGQERGLRPGTQDAALAAGFAVAAEAARSSPVRYTDLAAARDDLERRLQAMGAAHGCAPLVNGSGPRAPHVTNLSWPSWRGDELCAALDLAGVAVSSGSACSAGTPEPSPVIAAMAGRERASSAIRISMGEDTRAEDLDAALAAWEGVLRRSAA